MKNIKTAFVTASLALSLTPGLGMAQTELQFGHVGNPGSLFDTSVKEFAKLANERLGDDYKVEPYGSSQLGGDSSMMQKLKLGQLTFTLPSTVMSSVVDEFGLFEMPYLIQDRDHMKRVIDEVIEPDLYPLVEEEGYKVLAVWENGFRQITNNERPIETPEDLDGLKLRTPEGKWRVRMFEEYGANPSPMALSEVFTALQTGTMDGQENPLVQIHSQKFQEVQDYLSMTNHVYTPAYVVVSKSHWEDLPEDVREVLEETAQEVQDFVYETAAKQDEELLGEMEEAGMEVNEPDLQSFIDASGPVYERFDEEVEGGGDLVDRVLELGEED
ncbi:MAG: TRAP-type C4-dicarboxylate transport system, periplasmic component [Halomonas sp. HL-48]|nr:TRAP transporter substrate-binding protein [Halomonas sp. HL-48]KPQ26307.1 MAG: TRAP-type C4-dicarboxylate transport system, periplasmic component [Halomonas sp. HL-48]